MCRLFSVPPLHQTFQVEGMSARDGFALSLVFYETDTTHLVVILGTKKYGSP